MLDVHFFVLPLEIILLGLVQQEFLLAVMP